MFEGTLAYQISLRVPETLSREVLDKMGAPLKHDYPVLVDVDDTLVKYDAFLFGIPTRYGNFPAQWKVRTRSVWAALISVSSSAGCLGQNRQTLAERVARG